MDYGLDTNEITKEIVIESTQDEDTKSMIKYATEILALEWEMKSIKTDIKAIKDEVKGDGLVVKDLNAAIKLLKDKYKPSKITTEAELLFNELDKNDEIVNVVENLVTN